MLPLELWSLIFSKLSIEELCHASMVCKVWQARVWNTTTDLNLSFRSRLDQDTIIISILSRCINLRCLSLTDCYTVSGRILRYLPETIHSFSFHNCPYFAKSLSDIDLGRLPMLTSLKLPFCINITENAIENLPESLTELDLSGGGMPMFVAPSANGETPLSASLSYSQQMPMSMPMPTDTLDDRSSNGISILSSPSSIRFSSFPPRLRTLYLTDLQVPRIPTALLSSTLEHLDLSRVPLGPLSSDLLARLPVSLVSLHLRDCTQLEDLSLTSMSHLTRLRSLVLDGCTLVRGHKFNVLPRSLISLSARSCHALCDNALLDLPRSLSTLNLSGSTQLTQKGFLGLPPALEKLVLVRCSFSTSNGNSLLHLSHLKNLCLLGCDVHEEGFDLLPPSLIRLDISWTNVMNIQRIADRFPFLEELNLSNCRNLDRDTLSLLKLQIPTLRILGSIF